MSHPSHQPPEIQPTSMYDYTTRLGQIPDEDMMYHEVTIATSMDDVDRVEEYIVRVFGRIMHSLNIGCPVSFDGPVSVRDHLDDTALWLVRESFAFEVHFPDFANTMRLLARRCRDIAALDTGDEIYEAIEDVYNDIRP